MTKTRNDVINMSLRRIQVLSADEPADADMHDFAGGILDGLFAEIKGDPHNLPFTWGLDETPEAAFLPLSYLLATEVAPHYNRPSEPRSAALMRLRGYALPDDRTDSRDTDEDGVISEAEEAAGKRAAYY